jgi:hypothetical protein
VVEYATVTLPGYFGFSTFGSVAQSPAGTGDARSASKLDYMVFWYFNAFFDPDHVLKRNGGRRRRRAML